MPSAIAQFTPHQDVQRDIVRVFHGEGYGTPSAFKGQMNDCARAFWTVRWRSLSPDVTVSALRAPYNADEVAVSLRDLGPLPAPATGGYLSGFICERPVFVFGHALHGNGSNLEDVAVEWQYWDAAP